MVLGFGSKRKKPAPEPAVLRTSPSLPELNQQRIPWPGDLVDLDEIYASNYPSPLSDDHSTLNGPARTSFQGTRGPVPFHRPFRNGIVTEGGVITPKPNNITALFGSGVPPPPSSYNGVGPRSRTGSNSRTRRAKSAATFNLMFAGAKTTGKTSLIRLLLDTSTISPTNTAEQLKSLAEYRSSPACPTTAITTACVEILQSAPNRTPGPEDRITLTCIDTPGFDFSESREFVLDRAVSEVVKYVDQQFAESMGEESKVIRTSKSDRHVHLCIYLIDPESVMTPAARQAKSRWASTGFASPRRQSDVQKFSEYDSEEDEEDTGVNSVQTDESKHRLGMSPAEIRVITRLAKRVNVLPIIARSDTLTNGKLERIKRAVRRDLQAVDDIGIWGIWDAEPGVVPGRTSAKDNTPAASTDEAEVDSERQSRPVIKLRTAIKGLTRSRSRKSLKTAVGAEYDEPDAEASPGYPVSPSSLAHDDHGDISRRTSVGSVRGTDAGPSSYGAIFSRADLRARMPFAVIAPERDRERQGISGANGQNGYAQMAQAHSVHGRFIRKFRWGTIDVLDPDHCDFAALRAAVLGSYLRSLKVITKDVLYERFRTEKLLARRATANISEADRKRIMDGNVPFVIYHVTCILMSTSFIDLGF
ncbi:hypothetical protein BU17DRAFT_58496 [Hysterangium stoloniferum]|nr:hypothetical protein BU17DRAFT_58496 [Hysterangium stoloniferum]